jgi:hypothetical protein
MLVYIWKELLPLATKVASKPKEKKTLLPRAFAHYYVLLLESAF